MQIFTQLMSPDYALPWEDIHLTVEDKRKLGRFRKPIMQLLQREPRQRTAVCKQMSEIFNSTPGGSIVGKDKFIHRGDPKTLPRSCDLAFVHACWIQTLGTAGEC